MTQTYTPRRSAEQWQSLIDQWQASGQSAKQFCEERALGYASFCQWRNQYIKFNGFIKSEDWGGAAKQSNRVGISPARNKYVFDLFDSAQNKKDRKSTRLNSSHVAISYAV